jgi:3alpha(or 20beta)-hydroxysteroid dehydrogenase
MQRLEGKVAIITGAAGGLGEAQVRRFVAEGARVLMTDLKDGGAIAASLGDAALFMRHDVSVEAEWAEMVATALAKFGRLDILVNNAALYDPKPLLQSNAEDMERSFRNNTLSVMFGMQAAFAALKASGKGAVVNLCSGVAVRYFPGTFPYTVSKWALRGMSSFAAVEFGREGIRVNAIFPGLIRTPMLESNPADALAQVAATIPLSRIGEADEVAETVAFLASDASSYLNGAEIILDGGMML